MIDIKSAAIFSATEQWLLLLLLPQMVRECTALGTGRQEMLMLRPVSRNTVQNTPAMARVRTHCLSIRVYAWPSSPHRWPLPCFVFWPVADGHGQLNSWLHDAALQIGHSKSSISFNASEQWLLLMLLQVDPGCTVPATRWMERCTSLPVQLRAAPPLPAMARVRTHCLSIRVYAWPSSPHRWPLPCFVFWPVADGHGQLNFGCMTLPCR